ncbi:hypothetical protein PR202_ga11375 [Eleusine coracana subsp. coracana]|uniref:Uncharacterized protein n=1 Tax=Eleusine coracana subsp. coracana TaxID=191504 RepID=A0AAV5C916_ELECO|nr:hypothetical protein PR202_ga11375 [Eleusine coracana subsp. coracana]
MSFARYDVNLLLVAVTALSAALAFVAALHLYARCYLRPRRNNADLFPNTPTLVDPPPHEFTYALHQVQVANGLDAKALRALPVFRWESESTSSQAAAEPMRAGQAAPGVPPRVPCRLHRQVVRDEHHVPDLQDNGGRGGCCGRGLLSGAEVVTTRSS